MRQIRRVTFNLEKAVELSFNAAGGWGWLNLGNTYYKQLKYLEAIESYRKAIDVKPDFAEAYLNLGIVLKEVGELDEAILCYRKAIEFNGDVAAAYFHLGIFRMEEGKVDLAIVSYHKAIEVKPDFADAHLNLGIVLKQAGEPKEAIKFCHSAVKIKPTLRSGFFELFDLSLGITCGYKTSFLKNLSSAILQATSSQEIIAFGDSHVGVFDGIPGFEKVWVGAATAYNLIKLDSSTKGREKIFERLQSATPGSSVVLLCFGEVDCRSHILKHCIKSGRSIDEVCAHVVSRYFEFVGQISSRGFAVILCGPYGSGSDHNDQGSTQERYYASVCIEKMLRDCAKDRRVPYFSLHGVLTDAASQETRVEFFEDGLHFPGHMAEDISSEVKCVVLSRMLEAVNELHVLSIESVSPVVKETSLLGKNCSCLLDVFSDDHPTVHRLGSLPNAMARVEVLSKASNSIVVDLYACLNVEVLQLSCSSSSAKDIDIWGLDSNGKRADAVINLDSFFDDQLACVRLNAFFPPRSMLRYLVVTCPEGFLSTLTDFDIRGQSFVFI